MIKMWAAMPTKRRAVRVVTEHAVDCGVVRATNSKSSGAFVSSILSTADQIPLPVMSAFESYLPRGLHGCLSLDPSVKPKFENPFELS